VARKRVDPHEARHRELRQLPDALLIQQLVAELLLGNETTATELSAEVLARGLTQHAWRAVAARIADDRRRLDVPTAPTRLPVSETSETCPVEEGAGAVFRRCTRPAGHAGRHYFSDWERR
jgi:hypothetical protein